jgi:hypothetical protein
MRNRTIIVLSFLLATGAVARDAGADPTRAARDRADARLLAAARVASPMRITPRADGSHQVTAPGASFRVRVVPVRSMRAAGKRAIDPRRAFHVVELPEHLPPGLAEEVVAAQLLDIAAAHRRGASLPVQPVQ